MAAGRSTLSFPSLHWIGTDPDEEVPNGNDAMFAIEIATWLVTRFIRYARLTEHSEDCSLTIQISSESVDTLLAWFMETSYQLSWRGHSVSSRDDDLAFHLRALRTWVWGKCTVEITFKGFRYLLMDYWSAIRPEIPNVPYPTSKKICERHLSHCRM